MTKNATWNFHVHDSQDNSRYDMIIGRDLLSELQMDICFSDFTIRVNGGAYEECTSSTRDTNNSYKIIPFGQLEDARFRGK